MISYIYQADWKALRGALVGCLALMRRKSSAGVFTSTDAKAVAESFLQNLQVQSLGQHDRKVILFCSQAIVNGDKLINLYQIPTNAMPYYNFKVFDFTIKMFLQLCFELLECLLERYPNTVAPMVSFPVSFLFNFSCPLFVVINYFHICYYRKRSNAFS